MSVEVKLVCELASLLLGQTLSRRLEIERGAGEGTGFLKLSSIQQAWSHSVTYTRLPPQPFSLKTTTLIILQRESFDREENEQRAFAQLLLTNQRSSMQIFNWNLIFPDLTLFSQDCPLFFK